MGRDTTTEVGALGEAWAEQYLERRGLRTLARNYRWRGGEIDLIMCEGEQTVAFIEVRYRARQHLTTPEATVDARKQRKLVLTAEHYLARHPMLSFESVRFDVIGLSGNLERPQVTWLRDAFRANTW
ncbi:MAG: YraN family protein [Pseudomonadota bacterium]